MKTKKWWAAFCFVVLRSWLSGTSWAQEETYVPPAAILADYGYISQFNPDIINSANACGPTSAINSIIYLQNRYDQFFLRTNPSYVNNINLLGAAMGLTPTNNGVTSGGFIEGLGIFFDTQSDNLAVTYESEYYGTHKTTPTSQFIYDQLISGEDVEIKVEGPGGPTAAAHWMTAVSINYNPSTGSGSLGVIDPAGGALHIDHMSGTPDDPSAGIYLTSVNLLDTFTNLKIVTAVAVSVPEPSSFWLAACGTSGIVAYWWISRRLEKRRQRPTGNHAETE